MGVEPIKDQWVKTRISIEDKMWMEQYAMKRTISLRKKLGASGFKTKAPEVNLSDVLREALTLLKSKDSKR